MRFLFFLLFSSFFLGADASCPSFFKGDNCDSLDCQNGGYLSSKDGKTCICPTGYAGLNCEGVKPSLPRVNAFSQRPSFNFINVNLLTPYWGKGTYENIRKAVGSHLTTFAASYDRLLIGEVTGNQSLDAFHVVQGNISFEIFDNRNSSNFLADPMETGLFWCYEVDIYNYLKELIQKFELRETVITIAAQHPPIRNVSIENDVKQLLLSFGIKVNVLWTSDITFNDCSSDQVEAFKQFTESTGGFFVQLQSIESDQRTVNLIDGILGTHSNAQYITSRSINDCGTSQSIDFVPDPNLVNQYYFIFAGQNAVPSPENLPSCGLLFIGQSYDGQLKLFRTNGLPGCRSFNIVADGKCSAFVFTNANSDYGLNIYTSYVENPTIESSRFAIIENISFYAAMHIESTSNSNINVTSIEQLDSNNVATSKKITKRAASSFEYLAEQIVCSSSSYQYLRVNVQLNKTSAVQRTVRINCLQIVAPTTAAPATTVAPTTAAPATTVAPTTAAPTTPTNIVCNSSSSPTTFLFIYSNDLKMSTFTLSTRIILQNIQNNKDVTNYGNAISDTILTSPDETFYNSSINFYSLSLNKHSPGSETSLDPFKPSNSFSIIRNFLISNNSEKQNSVLILFLNRPIFTKLYDGFDLTEDEYRKMVNSNIKIFSFVSTDALANSQLSFTDPVVNKLSALTNGHFIVADDAVKSGETSDFSDIVSKIMENGYNRELLLSRNVARGGKKNQIGSINIEKNINLTTTLTTSFLDNFPSTNSFKMNFVSNNYSAFVDLSRPIGQSNFYTGSAFLTPGRYQIYFQNLANVDVLLRIWTDKISSHSASYNLLNGTEGNPNNIDGAELQLKINNDCFKEAKIEIVGCNGESGIKYDTIQAASLNSMKSFNFVPYFCDHFSESKKDCISGAENKYDVQIQSINNFHAVRSFICDSSNQSIADNCKNQDRFGNYQCTGSSPFKRGPTGRLTDCSGHGTLKYSGNSTDYNVDSFVCDCQDGFTGEDCSEVSCQSPNSDYNTLTDSHRTYTVILGLDNDVSPINIVIDDSKKLLSIDSGAQNLTIWKYQLFFACVDGTIVNVYSGGSLSDFQGSFKLQSFKCDQEATRGAVDLTEVYAEAVRGIGKNVNGIIAYYTESSQNLNISLNEFLKISQNYQQKFFVITADEVDASSNVQFVNDDVSLAAMSTGGFLIQSSVSSDGTLVLEKFKTFIPDLLSNRFSIPFIAYNLQNDSFDFFANPSLDIYLIIFKRDGAIYDDELLSAESCVFSEKTMIFCKIKNKNLKNTIRGTSGVVPYSAIVYAINDDINPTSIIIEDVRSDRSDAVSTSAFNTKFAVSIPNGFELVPNDDDNGSTRISRRRDCHFNYTTFSIFKNQMYQNGLNIAQITVQDKDGNKFPRYVPFATTSTAECLNGGTLNQQSGNCQCSSGFSGADCSFVECSSRAIPNAWSDVCVCSDPFDFDCAKDYTESFQ